MKFITSIRSIPITFAVNRYGFTYVVQDRYVTVLDEQFSVTEHTLDFKPQTWSSFGGSFVLYDRTEGLARFTGSELSFSRKDRSSYSAPYAQPAENDKLMIDDTPVPFKELNGLYVENYGPIWRYPTEELTLEHKPLGALVEPGNTLVFSNSLELFGNHNGITGRLMYQEKLPALVVPYVFPQSGVLAGGVADGYVFSPDNGLSYRHRSLRGFGVFAPNALLQVNAFTGVHVVKGWW